MTALEKVSTRRLLTLAASAFVVLAAEPLYLLVDTAVVGHLGSVPLAGLGVASALMALLLVVGGFLEYGTTGRAARWYGAGRTDAALAEGMQASWLAIGIGLLVIVCGGRDRPDVAASSALGIPQSAACALKQQHGIAQRARFRAHLVHRWLRKRTRHPRRVRQTALFNGRRRLKSCWYECHVGVQAKQLQTE